VTDKNVTERWFSTLYHSQSRSSLFSVKGAQNVYVNGGGATPGSNDLAGRSTALAQALALPCLALRTALVIVWTENKICYHIWPFYLFYFDGETATVACVWWRQLKKGRQLFWGKKCIRMTWLEDFLTSKWRGSFTALALPLNVKCLISIF